MSCAVIVHVDGDETHVSSIREQLSGLKTASHLLLPGSAPAVFNASVHLLLLWSARAERGCAGAALADLASRHRGPKTICVVQGAPLPGELVQLALPAIDALDVNSLVPATDVRAAPKARDRSAWRAVPEARTTKMMREADVVRRRPASKETRRSRQAARKPAVATHDVPVARPAEQSAARTSPFGRGMARGLLSSLAVFGFGGASVLAATNHGGLPGIATHEPAPLKVASNAPPALAPPTESVALSPGLTPPAASDAAEKAGDLAGVAALDSSAGAVPTRIVFKAAPEWGRTPWLIIPRIAPTEELSVPAAPTVYIDMPAAEPAAPTSASASGAPGRQG